MSGNLETISAEAKLLLTSLRLSSKPDATVVDDKDGIDGKLNLTSDGRKYYIATFRDPSNPFGVERTRVIAQTTDSADNPVWKSGNPSLIKNFIGKPIPGDIVTRQVPAYMVGDRTVDSCSLVVLKNEAISSVFKSNGHDLDDEDDMSDLGNIDLDTGEIMGNEGDVTGGTTRNEQMNDVATGSKPEELG
jgi:hypothetical protein